MPYNQGVNGTQAMSTITSLAIPEQFGTFELMPHFIPGARRGRIKLPNGWEVSAITAPMGSGIHGHIESRTFEVAFFNPSGVMYDDVLRHRTEEQMAEILLRVAAF